MSEKDGIDSGGMNISLFRLGLAVAVFYWLFESALHVFVFGSYGVREALFELDNANEFWMRIVIVFLLGSFGYVAEGMRQRERQSRLREQKLNRQLQFLSDVNQHVQRHMDQQALFDAACRSAVDIGKFRFAWIGMKTGDDFRLAAWAAADPVIGEEVKKLQQPEALISCLGCQRVLAEGISGLCELKSKDDCAAPWLGPFLEQGCRHAVAMPLMIAGRTVGVFEVYAGEDGEVTCEEKSILDEAADDVSVALGNIALEAERKQKAEDLARRFEELERFQRATVQREFRIKELRDENESLQQQITQLKGGKGQEPL